METQQEANLIMTTKHILRVRYGVCLNVRDTMAAMEIVRGIKFVHHYPTQQITEALYRQRFDKKLDMHVGQAVIALLFDKSDSR